MRKQDPLPTSVVKPKLRFLRESDDFDKITALLHRAYKKWADQGLRFLASYQDTAKTKQRCAEGHTIVAECNGEIVGLITVNDPKNSFNIKWYERPGVSSLHQFAIDPNFQSKGLGSQLLAKAENFAMSQGIAELALDTSEHARELINFYLKKGYRKVDTIKWEHTNYSSVVLSKSLLNLAPVTIQIRSAQIGEGDELTDLALQSKSYWKHTPEYLNKCRPALLIDDKYIREWPVMVLEIDSIVAGFYSLKTINGENRLDNLWIDLPFIGKGYGKFLLKDALTKAAERGWKKLRLASDPKAQKFYEKFGGKMIGQVQSKIKADLFLQHIEFEIP